MNNRSSFSLRNFKSEEIALLLSLLVVLLGLWGFLELTDEVLEGEIQSYDEWLMTTVQPEGGGPHWLLEAMRDITALGSTAILVLILSAVSGFLALQKRYRFALLNILTAGSGVILVIVLKDALNRERPEIVTHLVEVASQSYPSGHTMMSAVVYLTLATMVAFLQDQKRIKIYCITLALLLTFLVGISRVYLGVHYPSDVVAGWAIGLAWASFCWLLVKKTGWISIQNVKKKTSSDS